MRWHPRYVRAAGLVLAALLLLGFVVWRSSGKPPIASRSTATEQDRSSPTAPVVQAPLAPWADTAPGPASEDSSGDPSTLPHSRSDATVNREPLVPPITSGGSRLADPSATLNKEPLVPPITYGSSQLADPNAKVNTQPLIPPITQRGSRPGDTAPR